jgi:hypothetical protein
MGGKRDAGTGRRDCPRFLRGGRFGTGSNCDDRPGLSLQKVIAELRPGDGFRQPGETWMSRGDRH